MFRRVGWETALPPALLLALSVASCRDADPSGLQANVRLATGVTHGAAAPPVHPPGRPGADRIEDLLVTVSAGREGDGMPRRIETALRHDDAAARTALEYVRGDKATKLIVEALAAAGTPAAQEALCELARDRRLPRHVRAETAASLGLLRRPTAATMTAVAELMRGEDPELVAPTLFLAGSIARAGRDDHPTEAEAIELLVLVQAARARGSDDRVEALAALGNLGSPGVLPQVRTALAGDDARVRAAGARALRLVPDPAADRLLAATLRSDRDPTVRAAALFAAGFRKLEPLVDAVAETAETEPIAYVRGNAVTLLARHRDVSPRAGRALAFVASHDPRPDLRRLATGEIDPGR